MNFTRWIKKRPFITFFCVFLILAFFSGWVLITVNLLGESADLPSIGISSGNMVNNTGVWGTGLNMKNLPSNNLLENPSFEDITAAKVFTVEGGEGNSVFILPENTQDVSDAEENYAGGEMRIMSFDAENLSQKLQSRVTYYKSNQLGLWNHTEFPWTVVRDFRISAIAHSTNTAIAVGNKGVIISDISTSSPSVITLPSQKDMVDCVVSAERFIALADDGSMAVSSDGKNWTESESGAPPGISFSEIAFTQQGGVAVGEKGVILLYTNSGSQVIYSETQEDLTCVASDERIFLVAGAKGELLMSVNGVIFRSLSERERGELDGDTVWSSLTYHSNRFYLGGEDGTIGIGMYSDSENQFSFVKKTILDERGLPLSVRQIEVLDSGVMILRDQSGRLYCSSDEGDTWEELALEKNAEKADVLSILNSDHIFFASERDGYQAQLYTEIEFEQTEAEVQIERGDMLFLYVSQNSEGENGLGKWEVNDDFSEAYCVSDAPSGGGASSIVLTGKKDSDPDSYHILSQNLSLQGENPLLGSTFYRVDVWLKQKNISENNVVCWLSGNFNSVWTEWTDVGNGWRKYSQIFLVSAIKEVGTDLEQRFNIGFHGEGELFIDKVELKPNTTSNQAFLPDLLGALSEASPRFIRLENLKIGSANMQKNAWLLGAGNEGLVELPEGMMASTGITDLSQSLQMVKQVGANPWIVIDSYTTAADMEAIVGYLCGSVSDTYGKIRYANGKATPWSREFDRIIFEFTDTNRTFDSDIQKSAFVAYLRRAVDASAYRLDINDKVLFLDGMVYQGGAVTSTADYHTSDLRARVSEESGDSKEYFISSIKDAYATYFDGIPRILSDQKTGFDKEWIRSSRLDYLAEQGQLHKHVTAAEYLWFWMQDFGVNTKGVMADVFVAGIPGTQKDAMIFKDNISGEPSSYLNGTTLLRSMAIMNMIREPSPLEISYSPALTQKGTEGTPEFPVGLQAFAFQDGANITIIVVNISSTSQAFRIDSDFSLRNAELNKYSDTGVNLKDTVTLRGNQNRIDLLPGQTVVIQT